MSSPQFAWIPTGAVAALALVLTTACASPVSPTTAIPSRPEASNPAPVPTSAPVVLTVRVLRRSVETPLPGATVMLGVHAAQVNAEGVCQFSLDAGATAEVEVTAPGFQPLGAIGVLNNDQRWTFYLEPAGSAGAPSFRVVEVSANAVP